MLNSITWGQYITAIVLTLIFYYVVIGYKYFKWEILALIGFSDGGFAETHGFRRKMLRRLVFRSQYDSAFTAFVRYKRRC